MNSIICSDEASWLEARKNLITASDCAAILGLDDYRTAEEVFLQKTGQAPNIEESEPMRWGKLLQEAILREWGERTRKPVILCRPHEILTHASLPWLGCTLDGLDDEADEIPVEIKNVNAFAAKAWADAPPLKYQVQLAIQCAVLGASHGYLVALIGGQKLVWHKVETPHDFLNLVAFPRLEEFWSRICQHRIDTQTSAQEARK